MATSEYQVYQEDMSVRRAYVRGVPYAELVGHLMKKHDLTQSGAQKRIKRAVENIIKERDAESYNERLARRIAELEDLRYEMRRAGDLSEARRATVDIAKLEGLYIDRVQGEITHRVESVLGAIAKANNGHAGSNRIKELSGQN